MASSLSNLANNLSEGIHKMKCKYGQDDRKCETSRIKYKYYNCFLEHTNFKDDSIEYKGLYCDKYYHQKLDEKVNKRLFNTYKFSNHDKNKLILLLWKGVYSYEYMDDSKKINETSLPENQESCSHLNMENITDTDLTHAKREYHDVYVQSNRLFSADIFENFRNMS